MPHNIASDPSTGQYSMMYVNDPPWHHLGTALKNPPSSEKAIKIAHLDWEVEKYPLQVSTPTGGIQIPEKYAIMRTDLWKSGSAPCFGIVGSAYEPMQNSAAFQLFDGLVREKELTYETAGSLGQGERIWILAKVRGEMRVVGDDICQKYLLLSNSHDGQSSLQVKFTPIRVVCQNTLTMALNQGADLFRYAHNRRLANRVEEGKQLLGEIFARFKKIEDAFQAMVQVQLDQKSVDHYFRLVFPDPQEPNHPNQTERAAHNRAKAKELFDLGPGNSLLGVTGTLWAAYNGVTNWVDYGMNRKNDETRLNSMWFGEGYQVKARAFRVAVDNLKTWAG